MPVRDFRVMFQANYDMRLDIRLPRKKYQYSSQHRPQTDEILLFRSTMEIGEFQKTRK